jgi:hypothetical protein
MSYRNTIIIVGYVITDGEKISLPDGWMVGVWRPIETTVITIG